MVEKEAGKLHILKIAFLYTLLYNPFLRTIILTNYFSDIGVGIQQSSYKKLI